MINGMWKGEKYVATDIAKDYKLETLIRKASSNKELYCPDPDCKCAIKYCNGPEKKAYFSHINNNNCDYADFDSKDTEEIKRVRLALFEHFRKLNYDVELEVKLTKGRYIHLLFNMANNKKIAIQICTKKNYINYMDALTSDFSSAGIKLCWVILDDTKNIFSENNTCYSERRMFYETTNKELIAISSDCVNILQCKKDTKVYEYDGIPICFRPPYSEVFNLNSTISKLDFINNELTIIDFNELYEIWLNEKRKLFDNVVKKIIQKKVFLSEKSPQKSIGNKIKISFEEYTEDDFKKQKEKVKRAINPRFKGRLRDGNENIWLICKNCHEIKPQYEFEKINDEASNENDKYNYPGNPQQGYCKECLNK